MDYFERIKFMVLGEKYFRPKSIVLCLLIIISSIIFISVFYSKYFPVGIPLGWDAPYYIYKNHLLRHGGLNTLISSIGGVRVGYTVLSATITNITGLSARTIELILPIILQFVLSLQIGYIFLKIFQKKSAFVGAYLFSLLSFSLNDLVLRNNSDNLFALTLVLFATIALVKYFESHYKRLSMLLIIAILFLIIGTTHLETLFLADLLFGFAILSMLFIDRRTSFIRETLLHLRLIGALAVSNLMAGFIWFNYLRSFLNSYKAVANTVGINSSSFYSGFHLLDFIQQRNFVGIYIFFPLIILSFTALLFRLKNKKMNAGSIILMSWLGTMIILYIYFLVKKVPYNYMLRIVELTPLVAIAVFALWYFSKTLSTRQRIIITSILLVVSIYNVSYGFTKINHLFIPKETFQQLDDLNAYLSENKVDQAYVFVSTKKSEGSLGAFYGMWLNWVLGSIPPSMIQKTQVLFGEPSRFFECKKYDAQEREYEGYANSYIGRYCSEARHGKYFVILGFYDKEVLSDLEIIIHQEIAPGVIELYPEASPANR